VKYLISIFIGSGIAYIQSLPSKSNLDFASGMKPDLFLYMMVTLFFFAGGVIASYHQNKSAGEQHDGYWRLIDDFTVVFAAALGIGMLGAFNGSENFMDLITPYFGFGLASGLVAGKLYFTFYKKNLTKK
jgi:hypothetical protein